MGGAGLKLLWRFHASRGVRKADGAHCLPQYAAILHGLAIVVAGHAVLSVMLAGAREPARLRQAEEPPHILMCA